MGKFLGTRPRWVRIEVLVYIGNWLSFSHDLIWFFDIIMFWYYWDLRDIFQFIESSASHYNYLSWDLVLRSHTACTSLFSIFIVNCFVFRNMDHNSMGVRSVFNIFLINLTIFYKNYHIVVFRSAAASLVHKCTILATQMYCYFSNL